MIGKSCKGNIEKLIEDFHVFERPLFNNLVDETGFAWWDLVRYDIQFQMLLERGLHSRAVPQPGRIGRRTISALRRGVAFTYDLSALPRLSRRNIDAIIISSRSLEPILKIIEKKESEHFIVGSRTLDGHGSLRIEKHHLDVLISFVARLLTPKASVIKQAAKIEHDLERHFHIKVPVRELVEAKYRKHLAAKRVWSTILSLPSSVNRVVLVNDDTVKTLVWLCRQHGIDTTEVQHGYMGASHIGFSYPQLDNSLMTMPDRTIITWDTGDITYPTPLVRFDCAASVTDIATMECRDIDVLIGSGPRWARRTRELVAALSDSEMRVAVKLHPAQRQEDIDLASLDGRRRLEVFEGRDAFLPIARRAKVYVPVNPGSTTSFEAVENGCALVLYEPKGAPNTSVVNHLATAITSRPDELLARIRDTVDR